MPKLDEQVRTKDDTGDAETRSALKFAFFEPESLFWPMFESAPSGLLIVSQDGRIQTANRRIREMFGYTVDELVGHSVEMLLPMRGRAVHVGRRSEYMRHPSARAMGQGRDLTGLRSDGKEFPLEIGLNAIDSDGERIAIATVIDITERRRAEIQLREAKARLEEFSYVASHDLRSPIRGIGNLIEFLREDLGEDARPDLLRHVDRMAQRVEAAEKLIADLLAYARAGKSESTTDSVSLSQLVPWIVELEGLPERFNIEIDVPNETFTGSETAIAMVIRNLVSNAVKHHDKEDGTIAVRAWFENSHCVIEIADDGPGIPEVAQDRVWRLFQRLNPKGEGSGLGLSLVRRLIEGNGGSISMHSVDGERGTTFRVHWPRFARADHDD
jgi:PAS domain S-box-containing protein